MHVFSRMSALCILSFQLCIYKTFPCCFSSSDIHVSRCTCFVVKIRELLNAVVSSVETVTYFRLQFDLAPVTDSVACCTLVLKQCRTDFYISSLQLV